MRAGVECFLLLTAALLTASPAAAKGAGRTLDRLLPEIRRHVPGSFYDADGPYTATDGQERYHVKWMTPEGRIIWLDVDAKTGRVLGILSRANLRDDRFSDPSDNGRDAVRGMGMGFGPMPEPRGGGFGGGPGGGPHF